MGYAGEIAAAHEDGAAGIGKIVHGVDVGGKVSPVRHGARGGKEPREQHKAHHEEPHDEHCLLHGVAVVGHDESEGREEQRQQYGKQIDENKGSLAGDAVDEP